MCCVSRATSPFVTHELEYTDTPIIHTDCLLIRIVCPCSICLAECAACRVVIDSPEERQHARGALSRGRGSKQSLAARQIVLLCSFFNKCRKSSYNFLSIIQRTRRRTSVFICHGVNNAAVSSSGRLGRAYTRSVLVSSHDPTSATSKPPPQCRGAG